MKVIDIVNKLANGEEVPNFKIDGEEYYIKNRCIFSKLNGNSISWAIYQGWLNEEVEIIEDSGQANGQVSGHVKLNKIEIIEDTPNKIEKLSYYNLEKIQKASTKEEWIEERICLLEKRISDYHEKLNEIIDYINNMEK